MKNVVCILIMTTVKEVLKKTTLYRTTKLFHCLQAQIVIDSKRQPLLIPLENSKILSHVEKKNGDSDSFWPKNANRSKNPAVYKSTGRINLFQ